MNRRALLKLGMGAAAFVLAGQRPAFADLEPDRWWSTYRRYHLMILGPRATLFFSTHSKHWAAT